MGIISKDDKTNMPKYTNEKKTKKHLPSVVDYDAWIDEAEGICQHACKELQQ